MCHHDCARMVPSFEGLSYLLNILNVEGLPYLLKILSVDGLSYPKNILLC